MTGITRNTQLKRQTFLEHFRQHGNASRAAHEAGIHRRTVYQWVKHSAEFAAAFRDAEEEAAERLENALWQVAMPHPAEKVTTELLCGRDGRPLKHPLTGEDWYAVTRIVRTTEYDTTAMIALLKARRPEKYRERFDVRHSGDIGLISIEELDRRLALVTEYVPPALPPSATPALPGEKDQLSDSQQRHLLE